MRLSLAVGVQDVGRVHGWSRQLLAAAIAVLLGVSVLAFDGNQSAASAASESVLSAKVGDRDCGDFATQKAAQIFFLNHGGPQADPHRLDADGDGIACESNPCPCYTGTGGGGGGGGGSTPVKDTRATISVSRGAGIPGERLVLTVRVKPAKSRPVTVQERVVGGWHALARGRTNAKGVMQVTTRVNHTISSYRAVVPKTTSGSPRFRGAVSAPRQVRVQVQSVRLKAPRFAEQGKKYVVSAVARPVRDGRKVELWSRNGGGAWTREATGRQDGHGKATFRLPARALGERDLRVKVLARAGAEGLASDVRRVTVRDTVAPARPRFSKLAPADHGAVLWWKPVSAADLAGYVLYAAPVGGDLVEVKRVGPKATMTRLRGLTGGVAYTVAIAAFDEVPNVSRRSSFSGIVPQDDTAPGAPSSVTLTPGQGQLSVAWAAPADGDVASFVVRYRATGDSTWSTLSSSSTNALITGLADDTDYDVQVAAVDLTGNQSEWSALATAKTLPALDVTPPAVPQGLSVVGIDSDSIQVSWEPVTDIDLAGYVVQYGTSSDGPWTSVPQTSATSVTVDALVADTSYVARVAARDATGNQSDWSLPASGGTTP